MWIRNSKLVSKVPVGTYLDKQKAPLCEIQKSSPSWWMQLQSPPLPSLVGCCYSGHSLYNCMRWSEKLQMKWTDGVPSFEFCNTLYPPHQQKLVDSVQSWAPPRPLLGPQETRNCSMSNLVLEYLLWMKSSRMATNLYGSFCTCMLRNGPDASWMNLVIFSQD